MLWVDSSNSPLTARSIAVSFPMPVLAPVMSTVLPCRVAEDWHTPPAAYFLFHTHNNNMNATSWLRAAVNMLTLLQNQSRPPPCSLALSRIGAHGLPGLIIHRENRSKSYERRARAPSSQSLAPINARMFNPSPRRARWLVRAADRWLPLHLFAKLPLLHQYALLVCVLIKIFVFRLGLWNIYVHNTCKPTR